MKVPLPREYLQTSSKQAACRDNGYRLSRLDRALVVFLNLTNRTLRVRRRMQMKVDNICKAISKNSEILALFPFCNFIGRDLFIRTPRLKPRYLTLL